jgi:hypothetical protein
MEDFYTMSVFIMAVINLAAIIKLISTVNIQSNNIHTLEENFDELHREYREFRMVYDV